MTSAMQPASPRLMARIAGLLYLETIITGIYAMVMRMSLMVHGDPAATARSIMGSELLYRSTAVGEILGGLGYIGVTAILYVLLKPVSRTVSLAAAFFSLAGCAAGAAVAALLMAPTLLLGGEPYLAAFTPQQLQALSLMALRLHGQGYTVTMIFFGVYCSLLGYLVFRSTFFPRWLGVLLGLAGLGWLTDSFMTLVWPALESRLDPYIMAPGTIGESALCLWLIVVGLNEARWRTRAGAASQAGV